MASTNRQTAILLLLTLAACTAETAAPAKDAAETAAPAKDAAETTSETAGETLTDTDLPDTATAVDAATADTVDPTKYTGKCKGGPAVCDDLNPCTSDDCDQALGCVHSLKNCDDGDTCTLDGCDVATGACSHVPDACDDQNACTTGQCVAGQGCSFAPVNCADDSLCTADGCSPQAGCVTTPVVCDDGLQCSTDVCDPEKGCIFTKPPGATCCKDVGACDDKDACSIDACTAGICQWTAIWQCCLKNLDCNDQNPCTTDVCGATSHTCSHAPAQGPNCCASDADCNDNTACTLDKCVGNQCGHEPVCCKAASECVVPAAVDACEDPTCTTAGCGLMLQPSGCCEAGLKELAPGGQLDKKALTSAQKGEFAPVGAGKWDPQKAGTTVLAYQPKNTPPPPGMGTLARAVLPMAKLPAGAKPTLQWKWRAQLPSSEPVRLRAKTAVGTWTLWQGNNTGATWQAVKIDLSGFAGRPTTRTVELAFEVLPVNSIVGTHYALFDAIQLATACTGTACSKDGDCNDGLAATKDTCAGGQCVWQTSPEYCEAGNPCDDKNPCTSDYCSTGIFTCQHDKIANCCLSAGECDDKNVCSFDECVSNKCKFTTKPPSECCNTVKDCDDKNLCTTDLCPTIGMACEHTQTDANCCITANACDDGNGCTIDTCSKNQCAHKNQCCKTEADCDDGDPVCTEDVCKDGMCTWKKLAGPTCCEPGMLNHDFENAMPEGWKLLSGSAAVKWQLIKGKVAHSGNGSLYYGNPLTGNFDDNGQASFGNVTSPPIGLPNGETLEFAFWLWMDTEAGTGYDNFDVVVQVGAKSYNLWNKGKPVDQKSAKPMEMKAWNRVALNLSAFAGQAVTIQLKFDTIDGIANQGQGVFLDDFTLVRSCGPVVCNQTFECDDGLKESTETCQNGVCKYTLP